MAFDVSKFLIRFVDETREHCARISDGLLNLESACGDTETLNSLFRSAHTIKGAARMLKQTGISELAHRMEDVLDALRGGKIVLTSPVSDLLFSGVDAVTAMLARVKRDAPPPEPPGELLAQLASAASGTISASIPDSPSQLSRAGGEIGHPGAHIPEREPAPPLSAKIPHQSGVTLADDYLRVGMTKLDELIGLMGEIVAGHGRLRKQVRWLRDVDRMAACFNERLRSLLESNRGGEDAPRELLEAGRTLCHSLRRVVSAVTDEALLREQVVNDLQEASLRLRMVPLSDAFDSLRRMVRDLAREQGREVNLEMSGGETELDRIIVERISDSLLHMIRNSLDHGVENREERIAAGKPERGTISLSAWYEGGGVIVAVGDDGRGLPMDRIREKALAKRIVSADALDRMSKSELMNLIFLPGFSTSPLITDLSGRGVGMDVVRKNVVDDLRGAITIDSREGEGTTFFLRLPLNLAIFPLFLFRVAGKTCALPATSLTEMVTVRSSEVIDIVGKRAIRLHEQLVPIENLGTLLAVPAAPEAEREEMLLAIVGECGEKLGLVADEILVNAELVVKPLPLHMREHRLVSGVSLDDENGIIPILSVPELFRRARQQTCSGHAIPSETGERSAPLLVVDDSINTREIEKSILEAYGYTVVTAEDGEDAWQKTRTELYDLVITDVEMPRLDGFSLTERLRGDERYRRVPVIIVTSRQKEEDRKRGVAAGADAYIVKGAFDQSILLETVRSLIG